jgi:hypothetical protein
MMTKSQGLTLGTQMVEAVKGYVARALSVVMVRVYQTEDQINALREHIEKTQQHVATKFAIDDEVRRQIDVAVAKQSPAVHPDTLHRLISEQLKTLMAEQPRPRNGLDAAQINPLPGIDPTKSYPAGTWAHHAGGLIRAERETVEIKESLLAAGWSVMVEGYAVTLATQNHDFRTITLKTVSTSGKETITEFSMPVMIHRGVWKSAEYAEGDVVTWSGSCWSSLKSANSDKPGESPSWRLIVKAGRDGKDFRPGGAPAAPAQVRLK